MAYPVDYTRQFDYQSYQNANPTRPLPGDRVNADLNDIVRAVGETNAALRAITRSDGELANDSVGLDQISAAALAEIAVDGAGAIVTDVEAARDAALDAQAAAEAAAASILQFGPAGNGNAAEDTAAFAAFMASADKYVRLPAGTYLLTAAGITLASNKHFIGDGKGSTIIKSSVAPAAGDDPIYGVNISNVSFEGITFDGAGLLTAAGGHHPNLLPFIYFEVCSGFRFSNCEFIGFTTAAVFGNVVHDVIVENCTVTRSVPASGPLLGNFGIVMLDGGTDLNASYNILISGNVCTNCQISTSGHHIIIDRNVITGWGFSSGVNTQALASNHDNIISNNHCFRSNTAPDAGGYFLAGIENWASDTTITGNVCHDNWGAGLINGGARCTITGNVCYDNNLSVTAGAPGIQCIAQDATFNASGSLVTDNISTDTRSGGSKTQEYGYAETVLSGALTDISIGINKFGGNKTSAFGPLVASGRAADMLSLVTVGSGGGFAGGESIFLTSLSLANNGFHHFIASGGTNTANRTTTVNANNADRTVSLSGNLTLANNLTTSGNFAITVTATGTTTVTLPTTGTLATLAGVENLSNKTLTTSTSLSLNQNGGTTFSVANTDAGASAVSSVIATTNAGSITLQASSTAGSAVGTFRWTGAGAFFLDANNATGNFVIRTGATPTTALTISSSQVVAFEADRGARFNNQTSAAAAQSGTLTNAPSAGNPGHWLKINIGGTNYAIPCWAG